MGWFPKKQGNGRIVGDPLGGLKKYLPTSTERYHYFNNSTSLLVPTVCISSGILVTGGGQKRQEELTIDINHEKASQEK